LQKPVIILGIDPGTLVMGYSIIEACSNRLQVKEIDILKLSGRLDNYARLQRIHQRITELIHQFKPDEFAIEAPFFGKNVQSMLKLGRAQGVAIAAAMNLNIPVSEYSPRKVKQAITGNGNADKEQVWHMLQQLTSLSEKPPYYDATDALAVAICHHFRHRTAALDIPVKAKPKKPKSSWEQFVLQHPERMRK
jgi:crossover junction endodeoxyribonuclease RuvC